MKQYQVVRVQCEKGVKIADLFSIITQGAQCHNVLFELSIMRGGEDTTNSLDFLSDYYQVLKLNDYARTVMGVYSNLNDNWEWKNPNCARSLNTRELQRLISFADRYGITKYRQLMLGFDGIEWEPGHIIDGTYGFKKADSIWGSGYNYLSNSVIIKKDTRESNLTCFISCEVQYRNSPSFEKIAALLGKTVRETTFFAPEDDTERRDWERRYQRAQANYKDMFAGLRGFYRELGYPREKRVNRKDLGAYVWAKMEAERNAPTLNTKKIAAPYLQAIDWQKTKDPIALSGICYKKSAGDGVLLARIVSTHRGHMLQVLLDYYSEYFEFSENINFQIELLTEAESKEYFQNLALVLAHIEAFLNERKTS